MLTVATEGAGIDLSFVGLHTVAHHRVAQLNQATAHAAVGGFIVWIKARVHAIARVGAPRETQWAEDAVHARMSIRVIVNRAVGPKVAGVGVRS